MIPRTLARQIRQIEIITRKAVNDSLAGEYHSVFKGQGIEFDEVRDYQAGDDVRSIDWNVTARTGQTFVKRFVEERELTVMLLLDLSASGAFGSTAKLKSQLAAELCALLAYSAVQNQDKVGLIVFTDCIEQVIPPRKGQAHIFRLIRDVLQFQPRQSRTDLALALDYLSRVTTRKCVTFLISDFQGTGFERSLRAVARRHDLIAVSISDPREASLPDVGLVELEDSETGEWTELDTGNSNVRRSYEQLGAVRRTRLKELLGSAGVDLIEVSGERDAVKALVRFFTLRGHRSRT